jgi:hypothetical protein
MNAAWRERETERDIGRERERERDSSQITQGNPLQLGTYKA